MSKADDVFENILALATAGDQIRGVVMIGSRANNPQVDELADFDIQLYGTDHSALLKDDRWLSDIGAVWICIPLSYEENGYTVDTRLVIFEGGIKVDFALYPLELLGDVKARWDKCEILVDKDGVVESTAIYSEKEQHPPSTEEFSFVVNNFWFEVYHVAKYLKRGDLWLVKFRDWATKEFLLPMLEWTAKSRHGWDYETRYMGKHMPEWLDAETWEALDEVFGRFDGEDSWRALLATTALFSRLGREVAEVIGIAYPESVERNVMGFVNELSTE
jgi:aminoglycoside 6-adenylyltransferase